jgi:hypothetical protein
LHLCLFGGVVCCVQAIEGLPSFIHAPQRSPFLHPFTMLTRLSQGKAAEALKVALESGYHGIDCANDYGNEPEIGKVRAPNRIPFCALHVARKLVHVFIGLGVGKRLCSPGFWRFFFRTTNSRGFVVVCSPKRSLPPPLVRVQISAPHKVAQTLKQLFESGKLKREDIFIQAKLWNSNHRCVRARVCVCATECRRFTMGG